MENKKLIVITGPTASGKSALAERLGQNFGWPLISADSRQFYKEIPIGTAQPNQESLKKCRYYFVADRTLDNLCSAGDYEREALQILENIYTENEVAIVVGGSGLYINALLNGLDEMPAADMVFREELINGFKDQGIEWLIAQVPTDVYHSLNESDKRNPQRLMRYIEKNQAGFAPVKAARHPLRLQWTTYIFALMPEREILYKRIDQRVDEMIEQGLEKEALAVISKRELNALKTVGYQEWYEMMDGKYSRNTAIEKIKQHTRNFAKRQVTWMKKIPGVELIEEKTPEEQYQHIIKYISK